MASFYAHRGVWESVTYGPNGNRADVPPRQTQCLHYVALQVDDAELLTVRSRLLEAVAKIDHWNLNGCASCGDSDTAAAMLMAELPRTEVHRCTPASLRVLAGVALTPAIATSYARRRVVGDWFGVAAGRYGGWPDEVNQQAEQ